MKKILLSATMMMASVAAFATTDGQTYETKSGLTCENLWVFDRFHTEAEFTAEGNPLATAGWCRTATTDGEVVYVGNSQGGAAGSVEKYDIKTGQHLGTLNLTLNGEALTGTLCANQVGFDEYGHFYVASYVDNANGNEKEFKFYLCDTETGVLTKVEGLDLDGNTKRIDYCDVLGDLTGTEAGATILAVESGGAGERGVFNWRLAKGGAWDFGWDDGTLLKSANTTYPVNTETSEPLNFGAGSMLKMVRPSVDGALDLFYIDGFTTTPNLYDNKCTMIESFAEVNSELTTVPAVGTNGVVEGAVGNQNLFVYSEGQYDGSHKCQAVVAAVDEDRTFASATQLWLVPADGLGQTSDGGARMHGLDMVALDNDVNGKSAVMLVSFKGTNGLGVYRIAEQGYQPDGGVSETGVASTAKIRVNGDVIAVSEVAETIEVYNVAGQKVSEVKNASEVAAPTSGVYVVRAVVAGAPVVAKVIVK